jgi:hypothetical protein
MKTAVANLHGHILLFLRQAVKWYQMGPAGRALTALEQIRLCAKSIDDIARISTKIETRKISDMTRDINKQGKALLDMQQQFGQGQAELK